MLAIIISMDLSQRSLQTNRMLFFKFRIFFELVTIFQNNSGVGFMQTRGGEAFVLNSTRSILKYLMLYINRFVSTSSTN